MRDWAWLAGALACILSAPACSSAPKASSAATTAPDAGDAGGPNTVSAATPPSCSGGSELAGTYTVPVSADLEPYASFSVSEIRFCERDGEVTLSYDLPELLVGDSTHLDMRGTWDTQASSVELTGELGTASCSSMAQTWTCREDLAQLTLQRDKLNERLASLPSEQAQGIASVADVFSQDPIGVLTFTTP